MGRRRLGPALAVALLALAALLGPQLPAGAAAADTACFAATGQCVQGPFLDYWQAHGGLALLGYPLTGEREETLEDGRTYTVQYFERARLEGHPAPAGVPDEVVLGQLGREQHPADPPAAPLAGDAYFAATGHNVGGRFLAYWQANGGLPQFGYPLTEAFQQQLEDGQTYTVQYFERARFEEHPEHPAPYDVELGQLGRRAVGAAAPASVPPAGWQLVFADEFDGASLDRGRWQTTYPWGARNNAGNVELQYYADDAFAEAGGVLSIRAERRAAGGYQYTSGMISSYGAFATTYGYAEIRAKLPRGKGYWPGFWLAPADYSQWPPEIDVFEAAGDEPNTVTMTYHYKDAQGQAQKVSGDYTGPDFTAGFHTFAVAWSPGLLVWYVDGVERFRTTTAVAAQPMYVMANLAIDGKNPPDASTPFPATYDIDYIRVYHR
ncbi:MAG TPA: glycoside hydrolase family 16 protein [Thermomicrobiales bacterium]|nr:glycoside hydrolase family 16 protein [Thermomicrobiales bacterium]